MSNFEVNQHNLNSDIGLVACNTNVNNKHPMGVAVIKKDYWVANFGASNVSHYNKKGIFLNSVALATVGAAPMGITATCSNYFGNYSLLVSTNLGTIEGYNANVDPLNTVAALTTVGAIYTGLAIRKNRLYATNFATGNVEIYDNTFTLVSTFTDANLTAAGYAPYNVAVHGKHVYVAFARNDTDVAIAGVGFGYVNKYKLDGTHMTRLINNDPLNLPYGLLFSECGKYLYVANHGDGKINVFDREDGCFIHSFHDCYHNIFQLGFIYGLADHPDGIAVTAAINGENGLLAVLKSCKCESSH